MSIANVQLRNTEGSITDLFADALISRIQLPPGWDQSEGSGGEVDPLTERRSSFLGFATSMDPSYTTPKHIRAIADHLDAVERGEIKRLIVTLPPQHGKSRAISQLFPSYCLGRQPQRRIALSSYGAMLAKRNSRAARELLLDERWPWPNTQLNYQTRSVEHWQTLDGGYVHAVGIGGPLSGFSADILICDDPFKDRIEADSSSLRDQRWDWFQEVARTRLSPVGAIIIVSTRWHPDDIVGRVLASPGASSWTVLNIPAIAEEDDALGRRVGEWIWPEQFTPEMYPSVELAEIDTRGWEALYQQHPITEKGNLFKREWWQQYDRKLLLAAGLVPYFTVVDSSFKDNMESDFSVAATWGLLDDKAYLIDLWRDRVEFPELVSVMRSIYAKYKAPFLIEDKASGQSVLQVLPRETPGMPRVPVVAVRVPKYSNKHSRANSVTRFVEAGMVFLPTNIECKDWVDAFIDEHANFPRGHDDQVDTTSMALSRLFQLLVRVDPQELPTRPDPVGLSISWDQTSNQSPYATSKWIERQHEARRAQTDEIYRQAVAHANTITLQRAQEDVDLLDIMRRKISLARLRA